MADKNLGKSDIKKAGLPATTDPTSDMSYTSVLDWLGLTFHSTTEDALAQQIGGEWTEMSRGMHGYKRGYSNPEGFKILFDGNLDMGVHLQIEGDGCRALDSREEWDWSRELSAWIADGATATRADIAFDDRTGERTVADIYQQDIVGNVQSRWKQVRMDHSIDRASGEVKGHTIYYGSKTSDVMLRIYDKELERQRKGEQTGSWVRFEFQFRHDRAHAVARAIAEQAWEHLGEVARGYIDYKVPGTDSNKSRWSPQEWWVALTSAAKGRLSLPDRVKATVFSCAHWLDRQVAPAVALIADLHPDPMGYFGKLVTDGRARQRRKHADMLRRARVEIPDLGRVRAFAS